MLKRLFIVTFFCFYLITTFAQTHEAERISPGDTLVTPAFSPRPFGIVLPDSIMTSNHINSFQDYKETIKYREPDVHPWPATYEQLRREFMKVEIEDPIANLDLHLPSPEELRMCSYSTEGGFGLHIPLISIIYNEFSKEARSKEIYAGLVMKEKAGKRYNKVVVSRITGLKNDDEIKKFMEFCLLQIKFILESTDYELYAAIMDCYSEYCQTFPADSITGE